MNDIKRLWFNAVFDRNGSIALVAIYGLGTTLILFISSFNKFLSTPIFGWTENNTESDSKNGRLSATNPIKKYWDYSKIRGDISLLSSKLLLEKGFEIHKKNIIIQNKVNSLGEYNIILKIHKDITHEIKINVSGSIESKKAKSSTKKETKKKVEKEQETKKKVQKE